MAIVLHHARPVLSRNLVAYMGYEDGIVCRCGNDSTGAGFSTLNPDLTPTNLSIDAPDGHVGGRILSNECGRVYRDQDPDQHESVRLDGDNFPAEPPIHFWVDYSQTAGGFGLYVTTLTDELLDVTIAQYNVANS